MPGDDWTGSVRGGRSAAPLQQELSRPARDGGAAPGAEPVECLGLTFESEEARREHFIDRLRAGLEELHERLGGVPWAGADEAVERLVSIQYWPMGGEAELRRLAEGMRAAEPQKDLLQRWKDEVGFPHGEIEDILDLSDPPWHTACPNPFLGEFVTAYGKPYDPETPYRRKPFAVDVSEGKTHAVYRAHSYHTKVPHLAIIPSILHYTEPGDLVLDGFAGSGMTGVAAQWCGTAPQEVRDEVEARWAREGLGKPEWGPRRAILNDLSPLASFVAANYTVPFNVEELAKAGERLLDDVDAELGWMYETEHPDGRKGRIDYTVWSEVFRCSECSGEIVFTNEALDRSSGEVRNRFPCPSCDAELIKPKRPNPDKPHLERQYESVFDTATGKPRRRIALRPVQIHYGLDGQSFDKQAEVDDLDRLRRIDQAPWPPEVPVRPLPIEQMYHGSRLAPKGFNAVHHLFLPRAARSLSSMWRRAASASDPRTRHMLLYFVEQAVWGLSTLNRYQPVQHGRLGGSQVNRQLSGVYYVGSQIAEVSPRYNLGNKLSRLVKVFRDHPAAPTWAWPKATAARCTVATGTAARLSVPDNSIDYVFTDPPFGKNIYYADLNFLIESWHKVLTNAAPEAIVDSFKNKGLPTYQRLMQRCFEEYERVLKPGRWITVVFSNRSNAVWAAIQEALLAAGFVVADVRTMDKKQGSFRQVTSTAVKQDLIISAYKPNDGLEARFALTRGTEEGAWDFLRTHLNQLPVFVARDGRGEIVHERQPHVLFDRMVAFHVLRSVTVPLSVGEFLVGVSRRYPERNGMVFLPEQVGEYDRKAMAATEMAQLEIFVADEASAIQWLREELRARPRSFQDLHADFLRELHKSKHEKLPELSDILDQNFLCYDGSGEVPSQIHAYLSTNYKDLRNLPKDDPALRRKADGRWYVPDPKKAADVEKRRARILLQEFEEYRASTQKRLKLFRLEAIRAGFFRAYREQDYETIMQVADRLPPSVLQEDQKLLLWYDQAVTRLGGAS